ncbi:MAG: type I 3-dehydroquinate dehydratase [Phycisphaerae bacterium]|nr:type I 3-dehydroquinate dehydratase [Phycisphaerae bacterium]
MLGRAGARTRICVPIMVRDEASALDAAARARASGADLVELRIDEYFSGSGEAAENARVAGLVSACPLSCILTCRPTWEGGGYDGPEDARVSMFERVCAASEPGEHPPSYLDVEWVAYASSANLRRKINLAVRVPGRVRDPGTSLLLSTHDHSGRPPDLARRVAAMQCEPGAAAVKVAFRARSLRDNIELFDLIADASKPMIALGMGAYGMMSRVLAPKFGGLLTFASLEEGAATAPGQPTLDELIERYRFRSIGACTKVFGVIGWPVEHSKSPLVHNAGFGAIGFDGVYVPLPVEGSYESFKATVLELMHHPRLDFSGASVTIPHKTHLARLAREEGWSLDDDADATGSANTLVVDRLGPDAPIVRVASTDGPALVGPLRELLGPLDGGSGGTEGGGGRRVAVIGAGGVGRAAAWALARAGATVELYNRTPERAERAAGELGAALPSGSGTIAPAALDALPESGCHAIVNCSSVGMRGGEAPDGTAAPLDRMGRCAPDLVVMDTVYNPAVTPLLAAARGRGLRTIDGVTMFVRQAEEQFARWTGVRPPTDLFEGAVRGRVPGR